MPRTSVTGDQVCGRRPATIPFPVLSMNSSPLKPNNFVLLFSCFGISSGRVPAGAADGGWSEAGRVGPDRARIPPAESLPLRGVERAMVMKT